MGAVHYTHFRNRKTQVAIYYMHILETKESRAQFTIVFLLPAQCGPKFTSVQKLCGYILVDKMFPFQIQFSTLTINYVFMCRIANKHEFNIETTVY